MRQELRHGQGLLSFELVTPESPMGWPQAEMRSIRHGNDAEMNPEEWV